jgi:Ca-activated chloride channel family protein
VRLFYAALFLVTEGCCAGQTNPATPHFNVDTTLVLIPTTVTDPSNRYVLGLEKRDFQLSEDGTPQTITNLSGEDVPLSVALVFDTSSSMREKLRVSREAVVQFLKTMNAQDEACLIEFGDRAELASGFTSRVEDLQAKLMAVQPQGLTALFDAAELALREMKRAKNPRKAILIISDGGDNNSRYKASEIQALVREADVQIYAMGVFEPSIFLGLTKEEISGPRLLSELAEQTGGRAFSASDPNDLPSVAARIGIELRNQYVLAYSPKNQIKDGKYRKVEVTVAKPAGIANIKVRWRLGYYAPSE